MSFWGEIFFLSKVPEFLHVLSNFSSKTFPFNLFGWFALCLWEKRGQNIEVCDDECNEAKQEEIIIYIFAIALSYVDVTQQQQEDKYTRAIGFFGALIWILNFPTAFFYFFFALFNVFLLT